MEEMLINKMLKKLEGIIELLYSCDRGNKKLAGKCKSSLYKNPLINNISRNPYFFIAYKNFFKTYEYKYRLGIAIGFSKKHLFSMGNKQFHSFIETQSNTINNLLYKIQSPSKDLFQRINSLATRKSRPIKEVM